MLSDDYFCSNCKGIFINYIELRQSKRKFYIYRLPQVLIIQLKRFSYGKWRK
jgi:ubiquitin C-terminal hydrolase